MGFQIIWETFCEIDLSYCRACLPTTSLAVLVQFVVNSSIASAVHIFWLTLCTICKYIQLLDHTI